MGIGIQRVCTAGLDVELMAEMRNADFAVHILIRYNALRLLNQFPQVRSPYADANCRDADPSCYANGKNLAFLRFWGIPKHSLPHVVLMSVGSMVHRFISAAMDDVPCWRTIYFVVFLCQMHL